MMMDDDGHHEHTKLHVSQLYKSLLWRLVRPKRSKMESGSGSHPDGCTSGIQWTTEADPDGRFWKTQRSQQNIVQTKTDIYIHL